MLLGVLCYTPFMDGKHRELHYISLLYPWSFHIVFAFTPFTFLSAFIHCFYLYRSINLFL